MKEAKLLHARRIDEVVAEAAYELEVNRDGTQRALQTQWAKVNKQLLGGFRPGWVYVFGGLSGTGKSIFLTQLHRNFFENNPEFFQPVILLHFSFEMFGKDELIRSASIKLGASYSKLISAEKRLSDEDLAKALAELQGLAKHNYYFIEDPGDPQAVYNTVIKFHNEHPGHQIVVSIDHTLLLEHGDYHTELQMISGFSKTIIEMKKKTKAIVILLAQMNDKIKHPDRTGKPENQYPNDGDFYGSKQLFHAADVVMAMHAPERLNLTTYGPQEYPTKGLVAFHWLKNRNGIQGLLRMKGELSKGRFREWTQEDEEAARREFEM